MPQRRGEILPRRRCKRPLGPARPRKCKRSQRGKVPLPQRCEVRLPRLHKLPRWRNLPRSTGTPRETDIPHNNLQERRGNGLSRARKGWLWSGGWRFAWRPKHGAACDRLLRHERPTSPTTTSKSKKERCRAGRGGGAYVLQSAGSSSSAAARAAPAPLQRRSSAAGSPSNHPRASLHAHTPTPPHPRLSAHPPFPTTPIPPTAAPLPSMAEAAHTAQEAARAARLRLGLATATVHSRSFM
mmetsp:Transcript_25909/g.82063  ORF Transcript_25909/g.82063 Transcript_25909/m.82063 type:complete len:241 (-) Transcript_25909:256-978(-)